MKNRDEFDPGIDPNNLDKEWVNQPSFYFNYASQLADARRDFEEAKADLEVTKAELDREIRDDPEGFGLAKLTEAVISSTIVKHEKCKDVQQTVIDARHRVHILEAAITSLDHRKKALENLVSLMMSSYYATPKAPSGSEERMSEIEKKSVRRMGKRK